MAAKNYHFLYRKWHFLTAISTYVIFLKWRIFLPKSPPFLQVEMAGHLVEMVDYWPPFQHVEITKNNNLIWRIIGHHFNMSKWQKKGGYGRLLAAISTCWINKKKRLKWEIIGWHFNMLKWHIIILYLNLKIVI